MIYIMILSTIILTIIGYYIGKRSGSKLETKKIRDLISRGNGKFGIINYSNPNHFVEIEEIESAGKFSKIRIGKISCTSSGYTDSELRAKLSDWVPTDHIIWYDGNSQRLREEKLKSLLGDEKV